MVNKSNLVAAILICSCLFLISCKAADPTDESTDSNSETTIENSGSLDLSSDNLNDEVQFETIDHFIPGYADLVQHGNPFEVCVIFGSRVTWLSLSQTGYENERRLVRAWIDDDVENIRDALRRNQQWDVGRPDFEPTISICLYDLNGDGTDEYIVYLGGTSIWSGARSSGAFRVYFIEDGAIVSEASLPSSFPVDVSNLENSHIITVVEKPGMDDFIINQRLAVWYGSFWGW